MVGSDFGNDIGSEVGGDNRNIGRDSLFVMARLRLAGSETDYRVRVRNLSRGGLMAEALLGVVPGAQVSIEVRNIGWVDGVVAWVQDNRFGIAFVNEIDPQAARGTQSGPTPGSEFLMRRPAGAAHPFGKDPRRLRQV